MDSSNVGMVHLMMREMAFDEFECTQPLTLGLNVEALGKVMRMCGPTDRVVLQAGGDIGTDKLRLEFIDPNDGRVADFEMTAMTIETEPVGVTESYVDVTVKMPSGDFKKAITDLKEFGDALRVRTAKEGIKFSAAGDIGSGNVLLKPIAGAKADETTTIVGDAELDMSFGMRYVNLFTRATGLSKTCELELKQGDPMKLKYHLEEEAHGFIAFLLAPKMDE